MKRILSVLLVMVMIIGMLPMTLLTASAAGTYEKATSIAVGDTVILVCESKKMELSGISNTSTKYGTGVAYSGTPAGVYALTVCAGSTTGTFAFKTSANNYLYWSSGNSLTTNTTVNANASWKVTIAAGNATILNAKDNARKLQWNAGSPRFACYTSGQTAIQLYKLVENETPDVTEGTTVPACTHAQTEIQGAVAATCTTAGKTGNTVCLACEEIVKASEDIAATGHTFVDGVCSCGVNQADIISYVKVDAQNVTEGRYIIGAVRGGAYPAVYPATATTKTSSGKTDWNVSATSVTAIANEITSEMLPADAQVVVLTGNNNDGFSVGFEVEGQMVYLGYTAGTNRSLAFSATNSTTLWKVGTLGDGVYLYTSNYQVFQNSTAETAIRGYTAKQNDQKGLHLFKMICSHSKTTVEGALAATCTTDGATGNKVCANCGFVVEEGEVILAFGHNYVNGYCEREGCGEADPDVCKHENQTTTTVEATCTVDGSVTVTCDDCHEVISSETVAATGHTNLTNDTKEPTCEEAGYEKTICADCGEVISTEDIEAEGHDYVDGTCSVCGKTDGTVPELPPDEFEQASATITFDDIAKQTLLSNDSKVWEENGIVVTNNKDKSTSNCASNSNPVRFYKNSEVVIEFPGMTKIVINSAANSGTKDLYFDFLVNAITEGTVTTDGTIITIELASAVNAYTINCTAGQVRMYSITVYGDASACAHEVSEWTITVPATCETAGKQTGICPKCSETVEKEIPALGHAYSYDAEAGKMVCANCGNAFMNTIAEAKAYTDTNKVYYFKGIVTYVSGKTVYVQDDTAGVCVYFTNADNAAGIAAGDELLVWDTMTTYGGLIETTYTTSAEIQILSSGNELPAAQSATLTELLANPSKYQGSRVTISGMTMGKINTSGNTVMTAAEGGTINLYQAKGMADNVTENDIVDITVVFSIYSNAYQLLLNQSTATTDVVVTTEGVPSDLALSDISAAKAGTEGAFFKVKGIVTFVDNASVYMQDATGGIVARLASGVTAPDIGAEIEAIGAYTTFNGLIQLEGATFTEISTGNTVDAKATTLADLLAGATTNALLSEKVMLENLEITKVGTYNATYKNVDYTVTDGTNTFLLYRTPLADEANKLAVGDVINVIGVVTTYNGYQLRVVAETDITKAPTVEITHISLNPGKDALGFKAAATNLPEGAEIGIRLWVDGGKVILNTQAKDSISGLVKNIMAKNGGETVIYAQAVIILNDKVIAESAVANTSMMKTIAYINDNWTSFDADKQAAVTKYVSENYEAMKSWSIANIYVPETEEVPAA